MWYCKLDLLQVTSPPVTYIFFLALVITFLRSSHMKQCSINRQDFITFLETVFVDSCILFLYALYA